MTSNSAETYDDEELLSILQTSEEEFQQFSRQRGELWTAGTTKLLITVRLDMEKQFKKGEKSRNTLWGIVLKKMKEEEPNFKATVNDVRKKFNNLVITYKRIKLRKSKTGRGPLYWEHFEAFDREYGTRHNIEPPRDIVVDSLQSETGCTPYEILSQEASTSQEHETEIYTTHFQQRKRRRVTYHDRFLSYWEEEDEREKKRHEERMKMDEEKHELEKKKVETLIDIKDLLVRLVDN